jgi:hypothetical protein
MAEETITAQTPEIDPGMSVMPEAPGLMDVPTVIPELGLAAQALASQVSFAKKTWKDGSGGGTPVTAAELNRLEQGVADLTAAVNALRDSVSQSPVHFFNTEGSKGDVTLTFSSAGRAVALIITDGNGRGSSMMYVSGLSKYINKLAGDSSPSWSEDGSALTLKSTEWNNIIVVTGTSVEFSVAP